MRSKILGGLLLGAGIMAPTVSWSLGLGDMTVLSGPGEPFRAQIPLRSVTAADLDALQVRLAPATAFDSIGVPRTPGVEQLNFRIKSGGTPVVLVSSSRPLPESSLHFLVELEWGGGKLVKDYLARMRYPESPVAGPAVPQPAVTAPLVQPRLASVQPDPVATPGSNSPVAPRHAGRPAPLSISPGQQWSRVAIYGPVTGKDNLYRIAARMRSDSHLGMSQIMAALYQHNPDAFLGGNPDVLRPGAVLKAPPLSMIQGMSDASAMRILTRRVAGTSRPVAQPSAPVKQASAVHRAARAIEPSAAVRPEVARPMPAAPKQPDFYVSPVAAKAGPAGVDKVVGSATVQALQEENLASKKAYELLSQTVTRLNQKVQEQQKLLLALQAQRDAALLNSPGALLKNPLMLLMVGSNAMLLMLVLYLLWRQRRNNLDIAATQAGLRSMEKDKLLQSRDQHRAARRSEQPEPRKPAIAAVAKPIVADTQPVSALVTERPLASAESTDVDALDQAELYLTYGRVQQAQEALESALAHQPGRKELYVKLLDLYAKQSKLDDYQDLAERMRGRFGKDNSAWRGVMLQGALLFPGNPLFEDQASMAQAEPVSPDFMELDLSEPAEPEMPASVADAESTPATLTNQASQVSAGEGNVIDFDFGGLTFDSESSNSTSRPLGTPIESNLKEAAETDSGGAVESPLASAHEDVFAALDREFRALEELTPVEGVNSAVPTTSAEDSNILSFDMPEPAPATAPMDNTDDVPDWDSLDTKMDLAKAYVDMGDSDSARELLRELTELGDARLRTEAQQLLAAIA